jgi:glycosyltransferase involved in cell wall biosynthesis
MKLSIAIPIHPMKNAEEFLTKTFQALSEQTFKDFDVVITDNSTDDKLKNIALDKWELDVSYSKNPRTGMAPNTNEAIQSCEGDYIKILYLDDILAHPDALKNMMDAIGSKHWLICGTDNNPYPYYTDDIETGNNKLGSPSALLMKNEKMNTPLFDERMTWLLDCDYYKRMHNLWGEPAILDGEHVRMGIGDHQMTHLLTEEEKLAEHNYMNKKYE